MESQINKSKITPEVLKEFALLMSCATPLDFRKQMYKIGQMVGVNTVCYTGTDAEVEAFQKQLTDEILDMLIEYKKEIGKPL